MKPKIYIAGRVTYSPEAAALEFEKAEQFLSELGFNVINPMKLNHSHDKKWESYMKVCIKALCDSNCVYLLKDWYESKGAVLEKYLSDKLNIPKFSWHCASEELEDFIANYKHNPLTPEPLILYL